MKRLVALLAIVSFIAIIILGSMHWNKRVAVATQGSSTNGEVNVDATQTLEQSVQALPKHFPASLTDKLLEKKSLSLVVVGDEATSAAPEGWPAQLKLQLDKVYGEDVWTVTVKEWQGENTEELLAQDRVSELAELVPDMVLFEVPLLTDNSEIGNGNSIANVEAILLQLKDSAPDCIVVLQPPNPVYNAVHYPKAVEALKEFAVEQQYGYVDHWSAWPNPSSQEIIGYLQEEVGFPNEKGHELWAQAIGDYFTKEQ